MMSRARSTDSVRPQIRCAIYTRKSTEDGLEQEFNSLDAQRESAESFIRSQQHEGWTCLPERYDDGGFTGGNMDRPALRQLVANIEAGKIDCVVVYKVDRLSRSLMDFAKLMEVFDRKGVSFVSVTQQFNTTHSMGRLTLNILLSFAQFEREIISERTRDKIAATRRRGKWSGGMPILGYDVTPEGSKLVVHAEEAERVRTIFELYLDHQALMPVVRELSRRGWVNKRWQTRQGHFRGGNPFTKTTLHKLLTNVTYLGKVRYKSEVHPGEHTAIVEAALWQRVQAVLQRNGASGGAVVRNKTGALLKGLLRCACCDCAMSPTHTQKQGRLRYRYYVCGAAQKRGWEQCPSKSVPAGEIERFVVDQIRSMGNDPDVLSETLAQADLLTTQQIRDLRSERSLLQRDYEHWQSEILRLSMVDVGHQPGVLDQLADLHDRVRQAEHRRGEIDREHQSLQGSSLDPAAAGKALSEFGPVWDMLTPQEQSRLFHLLIERVDYDGKVGKVAITFHATGLRSLMEHFNERESDE